MEVFVEDDKEFGMGEGKGKQELEVVVAEDINNIGKMNKDTLSVFAKKKFGYNINLLKHIGILRGELIMKAQVSLGEIAADEYCDEETREAIEKVIPQYLKHPVNGRINPATPMLLRRNDLIPCTKDGRPLRPNEYYIPSDKPQFNTQSSNEMERITAGMERQIVR
jgi:hypothetical protein